MLRTSSLIPQSGAIKEKHVLLSRRLFSCLALPRCRSSISNNSCHPPTSQPVKELQYYHQYRKMTATIFRTSTMLSGFPCKRREAVVRYRYSSCSTVSGHSNNTSENPYPSCSSMDNLKSAPPTTATTTVKQRSFKRQLPEEVKALRRKAAKVKAMKARRKKIDKLQFETENLLEQLSEALQKLPSPVISAPQNEEDALMWPSKELMDALMKGLPANAAHRIVNALEKCAKGKTYATPKSVVATVGREFKLMEKRAKKRGRTIYPGYTSPLQRALQVFILSRGAKEDDLLLCAALEEALVQEPMCAASSTELSEVLLELRPKWPHYAPSYRGGMSPIATHESGLVSSESKGRDNTVVETPESADASFGLGTSLLGGDERKVSKEAVRLSEEIRRQLPLVNINKLYSVLEKQRDKPSSHRVAFLWQMGSLIAPYSVDLLLNICKFLCVPIRPPRIRDIKKIGVIGWIEKVQTQRQDLVAKLSRTLFLCRKRFILENQALCGPYSLEALEELSAANGIAVLEGELEDKTPLLEMPVKKKKKKRASKNHDLACDDKVPLPFRKPNVAPKGNLSLVIVPRHSSTVKYVAPSGHAAEAAALNRNRVSVDDNEAHEATITNDVIPDSLLPVMDGEHTVFLDNIPECFNEQDVVNVLSSCGPVKYARIIRPSQAVSDIFGSEQKSKSSDKEEEAIEVVMGDEEEEDERHLIDPEEYKEAVKQETAELKRGWILKKMPRSAKQGHLASSTSSTPHAFVTFCDSSGYNAALSDNISILGIVIQGKCVMVSPAHASRTLHINTIGARKSLKTLIHLLSEALKPTDCDVREMVHDTQNSGFPSVLPATISFCAPSHEVALLVEKRLIELGFSVSWKTLKPTQRRGCWAGERTNGKPIHVSPERMRIGSGLLDVLDIKAVDGNIC